MSEIAEQIKQRVSCFDLINEFGLKVQKDVGGQSYRTYSFTHDGKNPTSMQIWEHSWYCHSSKMSGDAISMYAWLKHKGDNKEAYKDLCVRFGLGTSEEQRQLYESYQNDMERLRDNAIQFHKNLSQEHRDYLHARKITDETIDSMLIGYDPYAKRIWIPIWKNGKIVYSCGRTTEKVTKDNPKYKKPHIGASDYIENELYGLDTLKRANDELWVAEGVFDFLSLYQEGKSVLCNATGMSNKHIDFVTKVAKDYKVVYLCFDNDTAGKGFTKKMYKSLFENNIVFDTIEIPKLWQGNHLKDISDCYVSGLMPDALISDHSHIGIYHYIDMLGDYEEVRQYIYELAPYISNKIKRILIQYAELFFETEEQKDFKRVLNRKKTELEYAKDFIKSHILRLCYTRSTGFMEFNGINWVTRSDETLIKEFQSHNDVGASLIKNVFFHLKAMLSTEDTINFTNALNFKNGTLYLNWNDKQNPLEFKEGYHNQDDLFTYVINYDCPLTNPKAHKFRDMIKHNFQGDETLVNRVYEYYGSCFIPQAIEKKIYVFYGNGNNSKSQITEAFEFAMPKELVSTCTLESLLREFVRAELIGKWVNFGHDDTGKAKGLETFLKSVADNNATTIDVKHEKPITFKPRVKMFMDMNELPKSNDQSEGWNTRFFGTTHKMRNTYTTNPEGVDEENNVYLADTTLKTYIEESDECHQEVMYEAIQGYLRIIKNGLKFSPCTKDLEANIDLASASNSLVDFANAFDFVVEGIHLDRVTTNDLYKEYIKWFRDQNIGEVYLLSKRKFENRIEEAFKVVGKARKKHNSEGNFYEKL